MTASEDQHLELVGTVTRSIKGIMTVDLDNGSTATCSISGKIRKNKIQIVVGDRVHVKISVYDLTRGFITYRM